ncbi:Biotin/lipoate A/B protein ligase [Rhizophlyctis rosea]|nr:Biotin/lipoate A/B protein ligase [Rhizophlyctis rosea]
MAHDNVPLIRRRSGGGTVYHDIGNTNYTVIMPRDDFDRRKSAHMISRALHHLDIPSSVNDRHDLVIDSSKISGSAYKIVSNRAYHHGTMLIDADLKALGRYLKPPPKNMVGKGVASVRSPVTRLREHSYTVDHLSFCEAVMEEFGRTHGVKDLQFTELDKDFFLKHPDIQKDHDELKTWDWTYGQTPEFTHQLDHQFSWGSVDAMFRVNHGIITEATIIINAKDHTAVAMRLIEALEGQRYAPSGIHYAFDNLAVGTGMRLLDEMAELKAWLLESI